MPVRYIYDAGNPGGTPRNEIRTLIADTGENDHWAFSDAQLDYYLGLFNDDPCRASVYLLRYKTASWPASAPTPARSAPMSISGGDGGATYFV